ncbi:hypothetical protein [Yersinia frederiksenii]|uniref:hypothetical protein n=1 Tax=Yersinia frederiksenii TaxID=29484 RepID=UPI0001A53EFE|nr:hypothetical protein [Yersinia frederiksenii]EEQ13131.1 hypothetical protein yfred0001_13090 [Yersinia frederiksenii ATCC 33641]
MAINSLGVIDIPPRRGDSLLHTSVACVTIPTATIPPIAVTTITTTTIATVPPIAAVAITTVTITAITTIATVAVTAVAVTAVTVASVSIPSMTTTMAAVLNQHQV